MELLNKLWLLEAPNDSHFIRIFLEYFFSQFIEYIEKIKKTFRVAQISRINLSNKL